MYSFLFTFALSINVKLRQSPLKCCFGDDKTYIFDELTHIQS